MNLKEINQIILELHVLFILLDTCLLLLLHLPKWKMEFVEHRCPICTLYKSESAETVMLFGDQYLWLY
jgi:hypothetical protein